MTDTLNKVSELGRAIGDIQKEQEAVKANISGSDTEDQEQIRNTDTIFISESGTINKRYYAWDSFILDHPVYGNIDSSILRLDGGYQLQSGLYRYYKFNNNDTDSIAYDYMGITNGTGVGYSGDWETTGKLGSARNFDGSTQYVSVGALSAISIDSKYSVSSWFYPADVTNIRTIFANTIDANNRFIIQIQSGVCRIGVWNGTVFAKKNFNVSINNWYHIIATWDGSSTLTVYANGVEATSTSLDPASASDIGCTIGRRTDNNYYFEGKIDQVIVWDRVLDQDEVTRLYNGGDGIEDPFIISSDTIHTF